MRLTALLLAAFPSLALADTPLKVTASFSILGDMVAQVAGDHAQITTIVGPDADAHVYTPNVADARAVAGADLIFVNGLGFETWSDTLIANSGTTAPVFVATQGITPLEVEGHIDPHAWNAIPNGITYIDNITAALSQADPAHAEAYQANANAYIAELTELHEKALSEIAALPKGNRVVVTAHDAFGYLAGAYGLTFLAPQGIDTEAEPSAAALASLIEQIKTKEVAALFVENITNPALVEQIGRETGLTIGGRLFSDALSENGGPATSYYAMFSHNLTTILAALNQD
ncbi:MAG: metal ABC transporter substrate-binding protein [Mangrovicoccus sp.]